MKLYPTEAREIIELGYKAAAKKHHPDHQPPAERGAAGEKMARLNQTRDGLYALLERAWPVGAAEVDVGAGRQPRHAAQSRGGFTPPSPSSKIRKRKTPPNLIDLLAELGHTVVDAAVDYATVRERAKKPER